jgi:glyoxylase-like metal-dependent hydrolase (beta-lactamase superfamily II)
VQLIGDISVARVVEAEGPFAPIDFLLPGFTAELLRENPWLQPAFVDEASRAVMSFHSYVLKTPRHTILVDGCVGNDKERPLRPTWHRQRGDFLARLARAGVRPEDIDIVFCTHLHADHVGWNTELRDGRWVPTFPKARYLFARSEYEHWERAHREALARGEPAPNHGSFADSVLPVMDAGQADLVASDHEIEDGLRLEAAPGHTPGTCLLHARSRGAHGVFSGDVLHTPVQLADPGLSSRFCSDPAQSARTRRALCERLADGAATLYSGHFPAPSSTRLARSGNAFRIHREQS